MRDKSCYAIFTCNAWKNHSSMRLSMVCTSKSKVIEQVNKMINDNSIEINDEVKVKRFRKIQDYISPEYDFVNQINNYVDFMYIEKLKLNEEV